MNENLKPFDPSDPYQICCEHFRRAVLTTCQASATLTIFRDLKPNLQVSAIIVGSLTGIIQTGFSYGDVLPRDKQEEFFAAIVEAVEDSIPGAEFQARTCEVI